MTRLPPRTIILACFTHLHCLVLPTAHIVRSFLLAFANAQNFDDKLEEAHGCLEELERGGVLRRLSQATLDVAERDRELCPGAGEGQLYGEIELVIPLAQARVEVPAEDRGVSAEAIILPERAGVSAADADDDVTEEPRAPIAWAA